MRTDKQAMICFLFLQKHLLLTQRSPIFCIACSTIPDQGRCPRMKVFHGCPLPLNVCPNSTVNSLIICGSLKEYFLFVYLIPLQTYSIFTRWVTIGFMWYIFVTTTAVVMRSGCRAWFRLIQLYAPKRHISSFAVYIRCEVNIYPIIFWFFFNVLGP